MDALQKDLDQNYPQFDVQILGINQITHEGGNTLATANADIPWLQDEDKDQDGTSDVWLNSWEYQYRDVVIVDANNVPVDVYNVTSHDLSNPANYEVLKQKFLDVASTMLVARDDTIQVPTNATMDLMVLGNDGQTSSSGLSIDSFTQPSSGLVQLVTVETPTDLEPLEGILPGLLISEVRPGQFVELFNTSYRDLPLGTVGQVLVSGAASMAVSQLAGGQSVGPRGYVQLAWPQGFGGSTTSGELALLRDGLSGLSDPLKIDDFVAWGSGVSASRLASAQQVGKWSGAAAPTLVSGSIHRKPLTAGDSAASYDVQRTGSPGSAWDGQTKSSQVLRYQPPAGFSGQTQFAYTVHHQAGGTATATVNLHVLAEARPWRNPVEPLDTNADGVLTPRDALLVINALNRGFRGPVPTQLSAPWTGPPFVDVDGSNSVEPKDVLLVINRLNAPGGAEGELPAQPATIRQFTEPLDGSAEFPWAVSSATPHSAVSEDRVPERVPAGTSLEPSDLELLLPVSRRSELPAELLDLLAAQWTEFQG